MDNSNSLSQDPSSGVGLLIGLLVLFFVFYILKKIFCYIFFPKKDSLQSVSNQNIARMLYIPIIKMLERNQYPFNIAKIHINIQNICMENNTYDVSKKRNNQKTYKKEIKYYGPDLAFLRYQVGISDLNTFLNHNSFPLQRWVHYKKIDDIDFTRNEYKRLKEQQNLAYIELQRINEEKSRKAAELMVSILGGILRTCINIETTIENKIK